MEEFKDYSCLREKIKEKLEYWESNVIDGDVQDLAKYD